MSINPLSGLLFVRRIPLAHALGVSVPTVDRWTKEGLLPPPRRLGPGVVGWPIDEIRDLVSGAPLAKAEAAR